MALPRNYYSKGKVRGRIVWSSATLLAAYTYWLVMSNLVIRDFWDPQYASRTQLLQARLKESPNAKLWLVMGSSRVLWAFRPDLLHDKLRSADTVAFNCGQSGADLFRQMVSLKRLLADRIKPDLLTIEVFAPQLCYEKSTFVTTPEFLVRARYDEIRTYVDYGADESALERIWRSSRFNPFSEYGMKNKGRTRVGLLFPNWIRNLFDESFTDKWGWLPSKAAPIPADEYAHGFQMFAPQYKEYLQDWHATPLSERCLMTMIAICKSHGIKTILVCMPNSSGLTNMYSKATCKSFNAYMSQIESQCGVKVINAASWVSDEGFADGVHLNATGAETFTLKLFGETFGSSSKNNITNLSWTSNLPISGIGVPHCIRPFVRAGSVTAGAFVIP